MEITRMYNGLSFVFFLVLMTSDFVGSQDSKKLVMTHVVFRHGDRAPLGPYPTDPHAGYEWPTGYAQLTTLGMRQMYELGEFLKTRYVGDPVTHLLEGPYRREEVHVRSKDEDRMLMSAQCTSAALFPPGGAQIWSPDIAWQPVPVHTVPEEEDHLLYPRVSCPKADELKAAIQESEEFKHHEEQNEEFYEYVSNKTALPREYVPDEQLIQFIYDTLIVQQYHSLTLPEWATREWKSTGQSVLEKMGVLRLEAHELDNCAEGISKLRGGFLLKEIRDNMAEFQKNEIKAKKIHLYSGHDTTIMALSCAMGVYQHQLAPLAGALIVELYSSSEQLLVSIFYRNSTGAPPYLLTLPGCTAECPLETFLYLTEENTPSGTGEEECSVDDANGGDEGDSSGLTTVPDDLIEFLLFLMKYPALKKFLNFDRVQSALKWQKPQTVHPGKAHGLPGRRPILHGLLNNSQAKLSWNGGNKKQKP